MIKEIIGTILCTAFNVRSMPQKAVIYKSLHGTYVLRDDFTTKMEEFYENHTQTRYYSFDITFELYNDDVNALYYNNGNISTADFESLTIGIQRNAGESEDADVTFLATINATETIITEIEVGDVPFYDCYNLNLWISHHYASNNITGVVDESIMYHTIYVNGNINLTGIDYELFDIFYTQEGNAYNTYYNGWYHCISAISGATYFSDTIQCQIITDNVLNNNMQLTNTSWYGYNTGVEGSTTKIYENGWKITDMNLYINGMLPNNAYNFLQAKGTFAYVNPPVENYTFQEFFFSIIDAPLYYIWSLFNWDLFGMSMFVAFCGLITMALVVAIVKKVV